MLNKLVEKIGLMIDGWEKAAKEAEASRLTHDGAIQAAKMILTEIENIKKGDEPDAATPPTT